MPYHSAEIKQKSFPGSLDYASLLAFYSDSRRVPRDHEYTDYYGNFKRVFGVEISHRVFLSTSSLSRHGNMMQLKYHQYPILSFCESGKILVDNHGFHTQSTYRKIAQFLGMATLVQDYKARVYTHVGKIIFQSKDWLGGNPSFEGFSFVEDEHRCLKLEITPPWSFQQMSYWEI